MMNIGESSAASGLPKPNGQASSIKGGTHGTRRRIYHRLIIGEYVEVEQSCEEDAGVNPHQYQRTNHHPTVSSTFPSSSLATHSNTARQAIDFTGTFPISSSNGNVQVSMKMHGIEGVLKSTTSYQVGPLCRVCLPSSPHLMCPTISI